MAIDMHSHWIPSSLLDQMRNRQMPPQIQSDDSGKEFIIQPRGKFPLPADYGFIEKRLAVMDETGVNAAALSISGVFGVECLPVDDSAFICERFANEMSETHLQHPTRIFGLGTLPLGDMELAKKEFERILALPGIVGCLLPGNGFLTLDKAERFRPFFEIAQRHKAHILIHTGYLPDDDNMPIQDSTVDNGRTRRVILDMQSRISSNMITLCLTDFLKPYPDVTVQCHNLGGNLPMEVERIDHISLDRNPDQVTPSDIIKQSKVLVDVNSMGALGIEMAVKLYGINKIVFGSDGTRFGAQWSRDAINKASISDADKRSILSGNANNIFTKNGYTIYEAH